MQNRYLIFDYETRSKADLPLCGAYEYSQDPSTRILCVAWRYGTKEELKIKFTKSWSPAFDTKEKLSEFIAALENPEVYLIAHNAFFEQVITRYVLHHHFKDFKADRVFPHERWLCTASLAAAVGLPRKLEKACAALGLEAQKDMEGHRLMLKLSKPRKPTKDNKSEWHGKKSELLRVIEYCVKDIDAECELFASLPPLIPVERKTWLLNQKMNFRGFEVDRPLVKKIIEMISERLVPLEKETLEIAKGAFEKTTQRNKVLTWLKAQGFPLKDFSAKTISEALLEGEINGDAKRILEIRQATAKTSTAKYEAFLHRSNTDGRVRDYLFYHGAHTGRDSGAGLQPHNFPRGIIKDTPEAARIIAGGANLVELELLYGEPMNLFSSLLRSMIKASEGYTLYCGDYAAIEVRVLFWLAQHGEGVKAYKEDRKIYEEMAGYIYRIKDINLVTSEQRQVGKQAILGAGFGMGAKKFVDTCTKYSIPMDKPLAEKAIKAYRAAHWPVPKFWYAIEDAAIQAVKNPGKVHKVSFLSWELEGDFLWCRLPSGRRLSHYKPGIKYEETPWGEMRPKLYYWSVDPETKKWAFRATYGGKLTENVVQATARDIMRDASHRLEKAGYNLLFSVHDELLTESNGRGASEEEFEKLMAEVPLWAKGLPIKVETWSGDRYKK